MRLTRMSHHEHIVTRCLAEPPPQNRPDITITLHPARNAAQNLHEISPPMQPRPKDGLSIAGGL